MNRNIFQNRPLPYLPEDYDPRAIGNRLRIQRSQFAPQQAKPLINLQETDQDFASEKYCCPICMDGYNTTNRKPLFINCGHSFCKACIISLKKFNNITCPFDKTQQNFGNIETYPQNKALIELIEIEEINSLESIQEKRAIKQFQANIRQEQEVLQEIVNTTISKIQNGQNQLNAYIDEIMQKQSNLQQQYEKLQKLDPKMQIDLQSCLDCLNLHYEVIFNNISTRVAKELENKKNIIASASKEIQFQNPDQLKIVDKRKEIEQKLSDSRQKIENIQEWVQVEMQQLINNVTNSKKPDQSFIEQIISQKKARRLQQIKLFGDEKPLSDQI